MEYVKLDISEQNYLKKNLLYSEMEILKVTKQYQEFLKLRDLELKLKSLLRKKIKEVKDEVAVLNKLLPSVKEKNQEIERIKSDYPKKRRDLQEEIEEIQKKLAELS